MHLVFASHKKKKKRKKKREERKGEIMNKEVGMGILR